MRSSRRCALRHLLPHDNNVDPVRNRRWTAFHFRHTSFDTPDSMQAPITGQPTSNNMQPSASLADEAIYVTLPKRPAVFEPEILMQHPRDVVNQVVHVATWLE